VVFCGVRDVLLASCASIAAWAEPTPGSKPAKIPASEPIEIEDNKNLGDSFSTWKEILSGRVVFSL